MSQKGGPIPRLFCPAFHLQNSKHVLLITFSIDILAWLSFDRYRVHIPIRTLTTLTSIWLSSQPNSGVIFQMTLQTLLHIFNLWFFNCLVIEAVFMWAVERVVKKTKHKQTSKNKCKRGWLSKCWWVCFEILSVKFTVCQWAVPADLLPVLWKLNGVAALSCLWMAVTKEVCFYD
jgi:hypothetical protein